MAATMLPTTATRQAVAADLGHSLAETTDRGDWSASQDLLDELADLAARQGLTTIAADVLTDRGASGVVRLRAAGKVLVQLAAGVTAPTVTAAPARAA